MKQMLFILLILSYVQHGCALEGAPESGVSPKTLAQKQAELDSLIVKTKESLARARQAEKRAQEAAKGAEQKGGKNTAALKNLKASPDKAKIILSGVISDLEMSFQETFKEMQGHNLELLHMYKSVLTDVNQSTVAKLRRWFQSPDALNLTDSYASIQTLRKNRVKIVSQVLKSDLAINRAIKGYNACIESTKGFKGFFIKLFKGNLGGAEFYLKTLAVEKKALETCVRKYEEITNAIIVKINKIDQYLGTIMTQISTIGSKDLPKSEREVFEEFLQNQHTRYMKIILHAYNALKQDAIQTTTNSPKLTPFEESMIDIIRLVDIFESHTVNINGSKRFIPLKKSLEDYTLALKNATHLVSTEAQNMRNSLRLFQDKAQSILKEIDEVLKKTPLPSAPIAKPKTPPSKRQVAPRIQANSKVVRKK
jgi:hypothetical protein